MRNVKLLPIAALLAAIAFSACENINPIYDTERSNEITISASLPDSSTDTKSEIAEIVGSTVKYTWLQGDAINVFFGASESSRFVTSTTGRVAQFRGTVGAVTGGGDDLSDDTSLWGVYPYDENTVCDGSSVTIYLPHIQGAKADNFADDLFPSVARSQNFTMAFYPICGGFRFRVSSPDIVKVTLSGNNNEVLAGKANVSMALGQTPQVAEISEGQKELIMTAPDGGCFETDKYYYFVLYPSDFSKGYTLTYYKKNLKDSFVKQEAYPIQRNKFGGKTDGDKGLDFNTPWTDDGGEVILPQEGDYIDEYGINHGQGIEIDGVIWAPVNCGYHKDYYPWGKLYQWGRGFGQGYNDGDYIDATYPTTLAGVMDLQEARSDRYANVHLLGGKISVLRSPNWYDRYNPLTYNHWTYPTESESPCPDGWVMPSSEQYTSLSTNHSPWIVNNNITGYWYSGSKTYSEDIPRIFLPTSGMRTEDGTSIDRCSEGYYWTREQWLYEIDVQEVAGMMYNTSSNEIEHKSCFNAYSVRCVKASPGYTNVSEIDLSESSVTIEKYDKKQLTATITPNNAYNRSALWSSSNPDIVTVSYSGEIYAVSEGSATITAKAGMKTAKCTVTVTARTNQEGDYIDEYGINHGPGIASMGGVIWAPVNCGYKEGVTIGKRYQWGRKYGYETEFEKVSGPASLYEGQLKANENKVYNNGHYDWRLRPYDNLWNLASDGPPAKSEYDPCPDGWIVPTQDMAEDYFYNASHVIIYDGHVHLADNYDMNDGMVWNIGQEFWLSTIKYARYPSILYLSSYYIEIEEFLLGALDIETAGSRMVRCVRIPEDSPQLIPVTGIFVNKSSLTLTSGDTYTLKAAINPSNASHNEADWSTDDPSIAIVDETGTVTAVGPGSTVIRAIAGMKSGKCNVTVN
jgi:uncharacterized protein (TIGR02145 family)